MSSTLSRIPIVDFSALNLDHEQTPGENEANVKELAKQMFAAFSTVGFVYIINHGMNQKTIDSAFYAADQFFQLSYDVKDKYSKSAGENPNGWDAIERESPNPQRPGDLKESYDSRDFFEDDYFWPTAEVPLFKDLLMKFQREAHRLSLRVLYAIAIGLDVDPNTFDYAFQNTGTRKGGTQMRFNYYPQLEDTTQVKPGQLRCGEHTDYGALTLLFQDQCGGLEVLSPEGDYMPATPIKGSIIVNIADIMQRWTSDKLISAFSSPLAF